MRTEQEYMREAYAASQELARRAVATAERIGAELAAARADYLAEPTEGKHAVCYGLTLKHGAALDTARNTRALVEHYRLALEGENS